MTNELLTCQLCNKYFEKDSLLHTENGEYYCKDCFRNAYCSPRMPQKHRPYVSSVKKEVKPMSKKMFPHPDKYSLKKNQPQSTTAIPQTTNSSALSKRPLQCPHHSCKKYVGVCDLDSHFKYEHKDVPIIFTQMDSRSALEFSPQLSRYGITHCMVILNLVAEGTTSVIPSSSSINWKSKTGPKDPRPLLIVLGTRVSGYELERKEKLDSPQSKQRHRTCISPTDKILIWLASNMNTTFSYTVAASSLNKDVRVKYFGPVLHLEHDPVQLCKEGKCLVLNQYHCEGMTENYHKPLGLDIVVHSDD